MPSGVLQHLLMLFVGGLFLVVIPAAVVGFFGLATPQPSSGGHGLSSSSSSRRHFACSCFWVTTIRVNVEKVFQFFSDVWVERQIMKKMFGTVDDWCHMSKQSSSGWQR